MATARSRISKGRSFQKKVKELIQECFELTEDDIRTPVGSECGPDIIFMNEKTREIVGHLNIECKNQQSISFWAALEQAKKRLKDKEIPILICHRSISGNRDVWLTCPIEHYLELRKELLELKDKKDE
jgi:hypothetical protein